MVQPNVYGILLAGGQSSRMGTDKALLPMDGKTLLRHLYDSLSEVCASITIVAPEHQIQAYRPLLPQDVQFVSDVYPGKGPLAGVHAGLLSIPDGYGFVMACDMPFFSLPLFEFMRSTLMEEPDAVVCRDQPFHAMYHKRIGIQAEAFLLEDQLAMRLFLNAIHTKTIDTTEQQCFINLNTPSEYMEYLKSMGYSKP
jgi:molybdopterin-guanine dinucleotide biosynthesis protein A